MNGLAKTLPDHHRFTGAPKPQYQRHTLLGICPCGCRETITTEYEYIRWDDNYFVDRSCLIKYMTENCDFVEVG